MKSGAAVVQWILLVFQKIILKVLVLDYKNVTLLSHLQQSWSCLQGSRLYIYWIKLFNSTVFFKNWLTITKYTILKWNESFPFYEDFDFPLSSTQDDYRNGHQVERRLSYKKQKLFSLPEHLGLTPFPVYLARFVLFIFLVFCDVCLLSVSFPNIVGVSGLSILDCPFSNVYLHAMLWVRFPPLSMCTRYYCVWYCLSMIYRRLAIFCD